MTKLSQSTSAFSLVELSIVLVILGLLTGGILAGQSLIRAAEIRGVSTDIQKYQTAFYTFRDKYFALPGDMTNATTFWGTLGGDGVNATCQDTPATGLPTCNGDGNGWIHGTSVAFSERFRAWQHLANAGLIEGTYSGKTNGASGTSGCAAGVGCPRLKMPNSVVQPVQMPVANSADATYFTTPMASALYVHDAISGMGPLAPEEAWNLDTKMDDGKPGTGTVRSLKPTAAFCAANCADGTTDAANYNLTLSSKACCMYFYFR